MVETGGLVYRSRSNMRVLSFCVYFCLVAAVFCGQKKNGKGGNGGGGSIAYRTECQQSSQNECSTTYESQCSQQAVTTYDEECHAEETQEPAEICTTNLQEVCEQSTKLECSSTSVSECSTTYVRECYHGRRKRGLLQAALLNRHSTRGTWSRSPQKLPAGKRHAAGMSPSKPAPANPSKHASMSLPATATQQSQPIRHVRQCSPPRSRQCVTQSPGSPARMCASRFQSNPAEVSQRTPAHKFLTLSVLENVHLFMFPFFIFLFLQIMILQTVQH